MSNIAEIPVIDISTDSDEAEARVAKELVDAAVQHGFIYIRNTGKEIPVHAVDGAFNLVIMSPNPGLVNKHLPGRR